MKWESVLLLSLFFSYAYSHLSLYVTKHYNLITADLAILVYNEELIQQYTNLRTFPVLVRQLLGFVGLSGLTSTSCPHRTSKQSVGRCNPPLAARPPPLPTCPYHPSHSPLTRLHPYKCNP